MSDSEEELHKRVLALYKPPFRRGRGLIFDATSRIACDTTALPVPDELSVGVGNTIATALTEYWQKDINTGVRRRIVVASACRQKVPVTDFKHEEVDWMSGTVPQEEKYITFVGVRHFDMLMNSQIRNCTFVGLFNKGEYEQGFVDQYGVYMSREEAYVVARDAGQLNYRRPYSSSGERLHSEDVW